MLEKRLRYWSGWRWLLLIGSGMVLLQGLVYIWAESLWFQDVGYQDVFRLRVFSQASLVAMGAAVSLLVLWGNLWLSQSLSGPVVKESQRIATGKGSQALGLTALLSIALGLALLLGVQMLYLGRVVVSSWALTSSVYAPSSPLPLWGKPEAVGIVLAQLIQSPWQVGALLGVAIAFVLLPQVCTAIAATLTGLAFGVVLAEQWTKVLTALHPVPFGATDPLFQHDISYYLFRLPLLEVLGFWGVSLIFFTLVSVTLRYLLTDNRLSQGRFSGFSPPQQRHLYALAGALLLATSLGHWLDRYEILYSPQGVVYGASYTNVHVDLPVYTGLSVIALLLGLALLWRSVFWSAGIRHLLAWLGQIGQRRLAYLPALPTPPFQGHPLLWGVAAYLLLAIAGGVVVPRGVQQLIVQPNELQRETPYITRAIAFTREAFDLASITVKPFQPEGNLRVEDLAENRLTLDNIRLWDTRPLLESNRQLQQIRLYYEFFDADVDRYAIIQDSGVSELRQVMVAARELNYERVPEQAKTWVNEHLVYTHGYGFTMSPVNTADEDGLPTYFVKDIAHNTSSEAIRRSIPIGKPRIYFGELTHTYIMTNTRVRELDFPSGDENTYTVYTGDRGISLRQPWKRLLFAWHLRDWQMLFTRDFTAETRLLYRRRITDRVQTLAPFLRFDTDPYLVVADIQTETRQWGMRPSPAPTNTQPDDSHLYWLIDAYTTSDRYPYADPLDNDFNYIRNSVKVVVDAYTGAVQFFVADEADPIIQTWQRLLPGMFSPLSAMPGSLRAHIRYPRDLFQVQSRHLMTYHMIDPQVFYNREDQWRAPNEIYGNEAQTVEPYYLIMKLPEETAEEFILLRPFTPAQRNNLVAWLAASSDGDRYGQRLLYRFPKQELVFGPEQIEARINQDPAISQRISLWDTQGSRAIQGNLLVIPIERSLLYVEPLYLEAEQTSVPTLARVILVYRNRIAMAATLEDALTAVFQSEQPTAPPVLRELEAGDQSLQDILPNLLNETAPAPAEPPP